eukprot:gb/GFBE01073761.1/.p1 GENE.gb/GFBE01073761.1/~~gb/GFBE01073761.1/.p1  ORF type:complete len:103 (+),score=17.22 gb/GFBE01073761.1/:1-309(+)
MRSDQFMPAADNVAEAIAPKSPESGPVSEPSTAMEKLDMTTLDADLSKALAELESHLQVLSRNALQCLTALPKQRGILAARTVPAAAHMSQGGAIMGGVRRG